MKFEDLRHFIDQVEQLGELKRIDGAHWDGEIGCITELMAEQPDRPALLFDNIADYPPGYRVMSNALFTMKRTSLVLGLPPELQGIQALRAWREKQRTFKPIPPVEVNDAPIKQNVDVGPDVDLFKFPAPRWHQFDGGRYIGTAHAVIVRDPDEGWVNLGTHRCMIQNRNTVTVKLNKAKHGRIMMDKYHAKGQACPVAISFGHDPTIFFVASDKGVPWGSSEYDVAGWLRNEPVQVTRGIATDLPIPATAEIVIEGEIPPAFQLLEEGPFGEWPGYLADTTHGNVPAMDVKAVLYRDNPIILGAPPLKPPAPCRSALPTLAGSIWEEMENAGIVGITGVWMPLGDYMQYIVAIAIKQMYAGHAKQAALAAASCRAALQGGRFVIVVDDDVDITDLADLNWALSTRCVPDAINIVEGMPTTYADPLLTDAQRTREEITASRVIINACRPYTRMRDFAKVNIFSPEYRQETMQKWRQLFTTQG